MCRCCVEHPRDVLCFFIELHPQELACPLQVLLLREFWFALEHQVVALRR